MGTFYRTIRLVEQGIKPVYVFDGKPPNLKSGELAKRAERRDEAQKLLQAAEEDGNEKLYLFIAIILKIIHVLHKKIASDFYSRYFFIKGNVEAIDKFNRRLVKVTKTHADEAKELLQLMGIPYIDVSNYVKKQFLYLFLINIFCTGSLRG